MHWTMRGLTHTSAYLSICFPTQLQFMRPCNKLHTVTI